MERLTQDFYKVFQDFFSWQIIICCIVIVVGTMTLGYFHEKSRSIKEKINTKIIGEDAQVFLEILKVLLGKIKLNKLELSDFKKLDEIAKSFKLFGMDVVLDNLYLEYGFNDYKEFNTLYQKTILSDEPNKEVSCVKGGIEGIVRALKDHISKELCS